MKRLFRLSLHRPRRLTTAIVLVLLVLSLVGTPSSAAPLRQGIHRVYITDVRNDQFVVSWTTDSPCTAAVNYGTAPDGTGWTTIADAENTTTHYLVITSLSADTEYHFDTVSGSTVDDNDGLHYTVTTGPTIFTFPPSPLTIGGNVYYAGATTGVPNAVVYLKVSHAGVESQFAAARTDNTGTIGLWRYALGNLRTADNNSYFPWTTGDTITATAQGGITGTGTLVTVVPAAPGSIGNITLDSIPNAVGLVRLEAHASTTNIALPLLVVGLLSAAGLLFWRRKMTQM